jgi:tetratricopeptide (TPR) repeat protein
MLLLMGYAHTAELTVLEAGSSEQLTALGNEALMQGRFETAIEHYRRALTVDRTSFQATFNLALAYQNLDKDEEARRWYDGALKISPDNAEVLCNLGYLSFRAKAWEQAEDHFLQAARQSAGTTAAADYWYNVGTAREKRELWLEARRAYDECLSINKDHFGSHFNLGTLYLGALNDQPKSLEKAEAALTKACELSPSRAEAWVNLALCHERMDKAEARDDINKAVEVASPTYKPQALWNRALFFDRQRPPQRLAMRDDLQAVLALEPDFPGANGLLGAFHFAIGEFDQAAIMLNREVAGDHFDAHNTIDVEAHYLLAMLYTDHRPDANKALSHASAYYKLRPDSAKIQELRRRALRLSTTFSTTSVQSGHTGVQIKAGHQADSDSHHIEHHQPTAAPMKNHAEAHENNPKSSGHDSAPAAPNTEHGTKESTEDSSHPPAAKSPAHH